MRLPADRRHWLEWACRIAAFAVLALMAMRVLRPPSANVAPTVLTVGISDLGRITKDGSHAPLHFNLTGMPTRAERAWQRALGTAGSRISWSGDLVPIAIASRPASSPLGGHIASISAPPGSSAVLRDDISVIDSLNAPNGFAALPIAVGSGNIRALVGRDSASVHVADTVGMRRILVIGKAGWETKFVITALEESGWKVDANISVAPNVIVNQGAATVDTARYSGVVALDESAAQRARDIAAFVRSGGGLILGAHAARSQTFAALRVGEPRSIPAILGNEDSVSHASATFASVHLSADAVPLERHAAGVSVAAKRVSFGRVIQIGYTETWRWRMQGNALGKTEHSDWWTHLLSQVVKADRSTSRESLSDAAPYADLVSIAGAAAAEKPYPAPLTSQSGQALLLLLLFALLLTEWGSRRLRGAR